MDLFSHPTRAASEINKEATIEKTQQYLTRLIELQDILFAQQKYSLLIVLQGLDASGKDGVVKKVFNGVNPMGCSVKPFKAPTPEELAHDFLWRVHQHTPARGMIQIFNRSHYEDVLVPHVEGWVTQETVNKRYSYINSFENLLQDSGTVVLKFFLHVSEEKQNERLNERVTNPKKFWKYDPSDRVVFDKRDVYMAAYNSIFEKCSPTIPWTIVPSDQNWYKEHIVAKKIVDALEALDLQYPKNVRK